MNFLLSKSKTEYNIKVYSLDKMCNNYGMLNTRAQLFKASLA